MVSGIEQHPKGVDGGVPVDLYKNMVLGEQELESLGRNVGDDNENDDKGDASLLSMLGGGDDDVDDNDTITSTGKHLSCVSCTGVLPAGHNDRDTEHLYCLSDGDDSKTQRRRRDSKYNDSTNKEQSFCSKAVRVSILMLYYLSHN